MEPTVVSVVDRRVATITLNRPDRLNAWTGRMDAELRAAVAAAAADQGVGAVVLTGAGRGFCAGADTKALDRIAGSGEYDSGVRDDRAEPGFRYLLDVGKPVIAAINGPAAGVGFVLACYCDLRYAAAGAKLTTSFGRLGLPAEHGVSWLLPRIVGLARAADLLFTSRVVLAEEAAELGLVNAVVPPEELMAHTLGVARRIAAEISPASLREMKRQLHDDLHGDLAASAAEAMRLLRRMVAEPDFAEGAAALSERRPPRFPSAET